jgi:hypothetical protein
VRNPARKALYCLIAFLAGAALVWFGALREQRIGEDWTSTGPVFAGLAVAPLALVFLIQALFAIRGLARLKAGHGEIARWHVYPGEWDRFRDLDSRRAAEDPSLVNDLWIRKSTPKDGVEVIAGERSLLVDGSYHVLRRGGLPELREVRWLDGSPACLEFALAYPRSRYGGTVPTTLRVPVPSGSRGAAQRVVEHFRPRLVRKPGLALRNPRRTYRVCALLLVASAAMAATGYFLVRIRAEGADPLVPLLLMIGGAGLAAFALILSFATFAVTRE